jgi:hypothetical protein
MYSAFAKKFFLYGLAVADLEEFITSFRGQRVLDLERPPISQVLCREGVGREPP